MIRKLPEQRWTERLSFGNRSPGYSFTIPARDENGFKALEEIRGKGFNHVADAVAQSADHVKSFFSMLRFIPDTLAEDGDPLDALVMLDEPTFPGCLVLARPVAVFWMHDEHGPDAKILTVPARDPRYAGMYDLGDVPGHLIAEIGHFFDIYKELEPGKSTDVRGWQDRGSAEQVIDASFARGRGPAVGLGEVQSFRDRPPGSRVGDERR